MIELDRLPKVGDKFTIDRYDGEVTRVAHRRVLEVRLREKRVEGEKDE
jgi:CBS domain containing-hemolysin-like protein